MGASTSLVSSLPRNTFLQRTVGGLALGILLGFTIAIPRAAEASQADYAELKNSISSHINTAYGMGHDYWYGENPYLKTPQTTVTPSMLADDEGVLCYTGSHTPTVVKLHDELTFLGHTLSGFDKDFLHIQLSDGDLVQQANVGTPDAIVNGTQTTMPEAQGKVRSWCFRYQGARDAALYDKIKEYGWLSKANAITSISEGDFLFWHSGSGRTIVHDSKGYQEAAKAAVSINPSYMSEVYLLNDSPMAGRIAPEDLKTFAEKGKGNLDMLNGDDIVNDYYDHFYGFLKHTSLASYATTAGLLFTSMLVAKYSVVTALVVAPIGAVGVAVVAPHYVLSEETLAKLSPIEVPLVAMEAIGGYTLSAMGSLLQYGGSAVSLAGDTLHSYATEGEANSWATLAAITVISLTPSMLRFANWASFGYIRTAGMVFFGGVLFAAGTGTGLYALLSATDIKQSVTEKLSSYL